MKIGRATLALCATFAAGFSLVLPADPASASSTLVVNTDSVVYGGATPITASLTLMNPAKSYSSVYVSPQYLNGTLNGKTVQLFAYCVDILHYSGPGSFNVVSLLEYLGGTSAIPSVAANASVKYDRLAALIAETGGRTDADGDAATQAAIWEILYDSNGYDLASGNFKISNVHNDWDLVSDSNSLLATAVANAGKTGSDLQFFVAENSDKQDMLFWMKSPVPEPGSWAMMLIGFGGIGLAVRRRRQLVLASIA